MHSIALSRCILLLSPAFTGCCLLAGPLAGGSSKPSDEAAALLSPGARALIDRAFEGIDRKKQVDLHVHIAGIGAGGTGCTINPGMRSLLHPIKWLQFEIYLHAAGVTRMADADREYLLRLVDRTRGEPRLGRFGILAFDRRYRRDGTVDKKRTEFYVPNAYVLGLAEE